MKRSIGKHIAGRIGQLILSLFVLSVITFLISRLAPGDPLRAYYGDALERMSPDQLAAAEEKLGLNYSLVTQYARWLSQALHGDFGISFQYKMPVTEILGNVAGDRKSVV